MEKNLKMVRDVRNNKTYWCINCEELGALKLIKRIYKDDFDQESDQPIEQRLQYYIDSNWDDDLGDFVDIEMERVVGYSLRMRTPAWRRDEIVKELGLIRNKGVRLKKSWKLLLD